MHYEESWNLLQNKFLFVEYAKKKYILYLSNITSYFFKTFLASDNFFLERNKWKSIIVHEAINVTLHKNSEGKILIILCWTELM